MTQGTPWSSNWHDDTNPKCDCKTCFFGKLMEQQAGYEPLVLYLGAHPMQDKVNPLKVRLEKDIEELIKDISLGETEVHANGIELPSPIRDLTKYADAVEHAIKTCPHEGVVNTVYQKEYLCQDCNTYFTQAELVAFLRRKKTRGHWS